MAIYTISPDLLRNIEKDEGIYFTDILFVFTQRNNPYKVARDKAGTVINTYREIKLNGDIIKVWLDMMSFKPSPFEPIDVDISNIECETTKFIKVCKETKGYNRIVLYSRQNLDNKFTCVDNIITFEATAISVLDRDEAKEELNEVNRTVNNFNNSQVAQANSTINKSNNK